MIVVLMRTVPTFYWRPVLSGGLQRAVWIWPLAAALALAGIPLEPLPMAHTGAGVHIHSLLKGEIPGVTVDEVSIVGPGRHEERADPKQAVVWLFVDGQGSLRTGKESFAIDGETIARAPQGYSWTVEVPAGAVLHGVRVKRVLTASDLAELKKYPQNNAAPLVKKFRDCTPYGEAIKSPKTVSRTLLPENYVPRMAMGTVETSGPDVVGRHKHPMLEQIFLGLRGSDITVLADEDKANLTPFSILHIPLGSNHGAEVAEGKHLHYVWMDFFQATEGQEWLKNHTALPSGAKK